MKIIKYITLITLTVLMLTGCNRRVFYTDDQRVEESGWNMYQPVKFDVKVPDTTTFYNFLIDIRNTVNYPYDRTFLFINTTFPDGSIAHDTLECPLADVTGQWYGKQSGHYISNRYYFKKDVRFAKAGDYHFEILHGMRDTNIVGLKNIGLSIEYVK